MGTTSEKLQKVLESKNAIKQAIIDKGGNVSDNMSEYASAISNLASGGINTLQNLIDNTKTMRYTFENTSQEIVDTIFANLDTSNVEDYECAFLYSNITTTPNNLNTSSAKSTNSMFRLCGKLVTTKKLDLSLGTDLDSMFWTNPRLEEVSFTKFNSNERVNINSMFRYDTKLNKINLDENSPILISSAQATFEDCTSLEEIPMPLDFTYVTSANSIFNIIDGCSALKKFTFLNIQVDLTIGNGNSWGHLITVETLIETIKELVDTGGPRVLTMGSVNLEKLTTIYVKLTDEEEPNPKFTKLPCEVCESTDTGAMSIIAYANNKNWTLA